MSPSPLIDLSSARILCIDDDPVMRAVIRAALQNRGCRDIVQTKGGQEALDICAGRGFDLVICDYQMAPMNGIEFLRSLCQSGLASGWPVIMLSAETNPETIAEAQQLGIRAWVSKPISAVKLIERVGSALGLSLPRDGASVNVGTRDMLERHNAQLMAGIAALENSMASFPFRVRESTALTRSALRGLEVISDQAGMLGYELVAMLAGRGVTLLQSAEQCPAGATRCHADLGRAVLFLSMAMKRVVHNRMSGDGGEAGLKLLEKVDGLLAPIKMGLRLVA